jgi:hypothetical protein
VLIADANDIGAVDRVDIIVGIGIAHVSRGFRADNRFGGAPTALERSWDRRPSPDGLG